MSKRAQRRFRLHAMKAKAERVYYYYNVPGAARKLANHLASCSCRMCGNPRKYFHEKTRQELKADLDMREQQDF